MINKVIGLKNVFESINPKVELTITRRPWGPHHCFCGTVIVRTSSRLSWDSDNATAVVVA